VSRRRAELPALDLFLWRLKNVWLGLLVVGAYIAVAGPSRTGGFLMLGAVVGQITTDLIVGVRGYRRVMRRPWPAVKPLSDDDWD
jgi:hypothetical protein